MKLKNHCPQVKVFWFQVAAPCWYLTCVSIKDLAAVVEQLKHLQLTAVGGDDDVAVIFAQELHVQNLVAVANKLRGDERERGCKLIPPSLTCSNILKHVWIITGSPWCIVSSYLLQCGKAR